MSFDRSRAQLRCEEFLDCKSDLEKWNACDFNNYVLTKLDANKLKNDLLEDAVDLYFKGLLSLVESLNSINQALFSWATIKAYYSVYYFLRCSLATKGYSLIRKKRLYLLKAFEGQKPICKSNNKNYNSDHKATINFFQDLFINSDILLSNKINEKSSYLWLMEKREQINYRERRFNEPNCSDFWEYISQSVQNKTFSSLITKYIDDKFIYCFQEEHAPIAIPIKRAILTFRDLKMEKQNEILSDAQLLVLKQILTFNSLQTELLEQLT